MSLNKESIQPLLDQLVKADEVSNRSLIFLKASEASFEEPVVGSIIWRWGALEDSDRLKLNYIYYDYDGASVSFSLMFDKNNSIKEIELWRGDHALISHIPEYNELIIPQTGKIY